MKKKYPPVDFINRKSEQKLLLEYFKNIPRNILFLYGPKSTGKTTLIKRVLHQLDEKKYAVSYLNTREKLGHNMRQFKKVFFPQDFAQKAKNILTGIHLNLGFFSLNIEDENLLEEDVFTLMMKKIVEANKEGITPVIILDEFQYLRGIKLYKDEDTLLIEELFKFFIALTKQNNLCHVVCLTSDSYYMEELYNDTKLTNTSRFEKIDHLSQKDIEYWLGEKDKNNPCPSEMVKDIWNNLGGSVWEIWMVFVSYKNTGSWKEELDDLLQVKFSHIAEYYDEVVLEENKEKFVQVTKTMAETGEYKISRGENLKILIKDLVSRDFWFFDTKTRTITPNSKSFQIAMQRLIREIEE